MTQGINAEAYNFDFFLSDRVMVDDLHESAKAYGGATAYDDGIYSNVSGDNMIRIDTNNNNLSVFVPSTINYNEPIDNSSYVNYVIDYLQEKYTNDNIKYYKTQGSWYDEELEQVVVEDITIVTVELENVSKEDIRYFVRLAMYLKETMVQRNVSISINTALAIV